MIIVDDLKKTTICKSWDALKEILYNKNDKNCNEFRIYNENEYPQLYILVNDDKACVHFFRTSNDCGSYAYCENFTINKQNVTKFYIGLGTETTEISNELVIPFSKIFIIAKDFFLSLDKSKNISWFDL